MSTKLTTHVLDIASGRPAAGVRVRLLRDSTELADIITNANGRCDTPLLEGDFLTPGSYELHFHMGDYFRALSLPCPLFDVIPIPFQVEAGQSYHIPLVCSPWAYSTYRGS